MQSLVGGDSQKLALLERQNDMLDMITLRFDEGKSYAAGDYVLYFNGAFDGLYRFKSPKTTGPWDGAYADQVSLTQILKEQSSSLSKLGEEIKSKITVLTAYNYTIGDTLKIPYSEKVRRCIIFPAYSNINSFKLNVCTGSVSPGDSVVISPVFDNDGNMKTDGTYDFILFFIEI